MAVTELGYMGLNVSNLEAWKHFASDILGLEVVEQGSETCFLRMDYWHHRLVLHAGGDDDLAYLGFRVAGPHEFVAIQRELADAGIEFRVAGQDEAAERRVLELLKLEDPDGNPVEVFHGPLVRFSKPFHPGRGMHGRFVTGGGGLGHCIIRQRDAEAGVRFYETLGMRGGVEYKIGAGARAVELYFMHCNSRDHTVAWGIGSPDKRLNHLMLEVDNLDDVGLTHELVRRAELPVRIQLGKHSNDHMYSFYFASPSGFMIEYGFGARHATHQSEYYTEDFYGHRPEAGGF